MKVLVVGSGAREHALAWRLLQNASVEEVIVAPGNAGIERQERCRCVNEAVNADLVRRLGCAFVIIGPEMPLVEGLADQLRAQGVPVVGPGAALAQLEGSKAFAKQFMERHRIPTAAAQRCTTLSEAASALDRFGLPVVVKADGLAAGKGVTVCFDRAAADSAVHDALEARIFGAAGESVLIEQYLDGYEASVIVLVDETSHLTLPPAQDHKAVHEGGTGPNTGGMGVVAPHPRIGAEAIAEIERRIVVPSVHGLRAEEGLFRGMLFIGLMITATETYVLEYNVRFGDPEAQALLPLIDGDFGLLMRGLADGRLGTAAREARFAVREGAACAVVAAAAGYPHAYHSGDRIQVEQPAPCIFYAGVRAATASGESELETAGGRVLTVVAVGPDLDQARRAAYTDLHRVRFDGMHVRRDIGGSSLMDTLREEGQALLLDFEKRGGLLPVVVQEVGSGEILMLAYADRDALRTTMRHGYAAFYSTSRRRSWVKGEQSGNRLKVVEIRVDCDQDALVYRVQLEGAGACHTKNALGNPRRSCFYRTVTHTGDLRFDPPSQR